MASKEEGFQITDENDFEYTVLRKWYLTQFSIPAGKSVVLEVEYTVKNNLSDWANNKSSFTEFSERIFRYDFSPAGFWGDGEIGDFKLSLDLSDLALIDAEGQLLINGLELNKDGNHYHYQVRDFDPAVAKTLEVQYQVETDRNSWTFWNTSYRRADLAGLQVSSQLEGYSKSNLFDRDLGTAWVEGAPDNGAGQKITIDVGGQPVYAIGIIGGYTKSEYAYGINNRIKKVRLQLEYDPTDGYERAPDSLDDEYVLSDLPFAQLNEENCGQLIQIVGDFGEMGIRNVKKISLTILETYAGSKYNDTCISEIFLLKYYQN